jgi:hypothetical protein
MQKGTCTRCGKSFQECASHWDCDANLKAAPKKVEYQIQFPNGTRNPGKFTSPTQAREYADAMPWFTGYEIVKAN